MRKLILAAFFVAAMSTAFGQHDTQLLTRDQPYRLQPGDVLEIQYVFTPEYNQVATVEPDGTVRLKLIGAIKVASLSLDQATTVITEKASVPLNKPELTLTLKEFVKPHFTVCGEVVKPGVYDIHGQVTMLQALAISGGLKETSKESNVVLVRKVNSEVAETKVINAKFLSTEKGAHEDFLLRPDDLLIVPKNKLGKIEPYVRVGSMGLSSLWGVEILK
jgi:polysaccharide biosynthesis/export protein